MSRLSCKSPGLGSDQVIALGKAIEKLRERRLLSMEAFCKEAGWSHTVYYRCMRGQPLSQMSVWRIKVWLKAQNARSAA